MRSVLVAVVALSLVSCAQPPLPSIQREGTAVAAPSARVWDAVIDQFAERNIPIRTMERVSGFIATEPLNVDLRDYQKEYYDCGSDMGVPKFANRAVYNAVVRGDSTRATVRVTVKWSIVGGTASLLSGATASLDCSTMGAWETEFEAAVRTRAEGR